MAKIYEQLPLINQTTAVKNFFESTVEQLFAEANSEIITGFIGKKTSSDHNVDVAYLIEPTVERQFYSLSPVLNTINLTSGKSEDFVFIDEAISTLKIYGANTINQDKIFKSDFKTFLPPINVDKFVNFQEYYFDPETTANCHTVRTWSANTDFNINEIIVNGTDYYIANRNFTSSNVFVKDASIDSYTFTSDISQSKEAIVTTNQDHNFFSGDKITITGVSGMTEVNNQTYFVEKVTSRTFKLYTDKDLRLPLDTSSFNTWTSGGKITHNSGPTPISIAGNVTNYIDVELDITNKKQYTPAGGKAFRNGMIVKFTGNYVLSSEITLDREYVVEGVGDSIKLVDREVSNSAPYSFTTGKDYINLARGSDNKNIWSRNNFWWHKQNYLDAEDRIPNSSKRALRAILEYDADLELYNHGTTYKGNIDISVSDLTFNQASNLTAGQSIDGIELTTGLTAIFPNESETVNKEIYEVTVSGSTVSFNAISGRTFSIGDIVSVHQGTNNIGLEYYYTSTGLKVAQSKPNKSTPPLFNLYKDDKTFLGDETLYPFNNFEGNKIFGHKEGTGANDTEYGFPLSFKAFKSASEIDFENYALTRNYEYTAIGSTTPTQQTGYFYYKLLKSTPEYHGVFKNTNKKSTQTIDTHFEISSIDVDNEKVLYFCGAEPNVDADNSSGFDITVKVNGKNNSDFTYNGNGFINFNSFSFVKGTLIDIHVKSDSGLISENSISKYSIPLSWRGNPLSEEITTVAEPQYLQHFTNYMESQKGFSGNVLSSNNFTELDKKPEYATDIVLPTQDSLLGVFLLNKKPYNLIDAIRFNNSEYSKFKKRFRKELDSYFNKFDVSGFSNEFVLEKVIRNVISFSVGRKVFNQTYLLPFGDNYTEESISITDTNVVDYTLTNYKDLDKIENSLLVYKDSENTRTLLCVDKDYTFTSFNPITVSLLNKEEFSTGDTLVFKLYDEDRDSAQCPPTPSALGLYPLYQPCIDIDNSFQTAQNLLVGHDGSKSSLIGDRRDDIILELENRLYNSAKAEFRNANSVPSYSAIDIRPGHFRNSDLDNNDWNDLLNFNFSNWVSENQVDPVTNDFFNLTNEFTWNYRGNTDKPGHWRGWYEYYYDTVRPHTHPWEMLGFTEKPSWWDTTYITAIYTDYSSANTPMWSDIEQGKIVSGNRENVTDGTYKLDEFNPYKRIGLLDLLPVDSNASLKSPYDITNTGSTTLTPTWTNSVADSTQGYPTTSFRNLDGINVNYDSGNIFVSSQNIINHNVTIIDNSIEYAKSKEQQLRYRIPRVNLNTISTVANQAQGSNAIAIAINGLPIYNVQDTNVWNASNFHYNKAETEKSAFALGNTTSDGVQYYYTLSEDVVGSTAWGNSTTHSGIVAWAFDGLPIYGPYGYKGLAANGEITDSTISNIKSCFELKTGTRDTIQGGKGAHTGEFTEDFTYNSANQGALGYVGNDGNGKFNVRYGKTPDSPNTAIRYYVITTDDNGDPMFPYHVGGGTKVFGSQTTTYGNNYFATPIDSGNNNNSGTFDSTSNDAIVSLFSEVQTTTNNISDPWKIGDGAPVENAWKYSSVYPFAVVEALLTAKPGLFATVFSDPTKVIKPDVDARSFISKQSRKKWLFTSDSDFEIHGDKDSSGNIITNIGYTQFINSWLNFQGLSTSEDFAEKLRTINLKLGHRFAGFVDKDTLRLTLDQYSATGSSTNLILPEDNITVDIHESPYKTRNYYSGVIIEKTTDGWKVRGFDKKSGYFDTLKLDTNGTTESVSVGGDTVSHSTWASNVSYSENSFVIHNGGYYRATSDVPSSETFNVLFWQALNNLPTENSATATYYQQSTDIVERVYYETEYTDTQTLFDFLIGLGNFQKRSGYDLANYDVSISDTRDWLFAAKQYLFWTTGSWQVGNTIELSPLANRLKFTPPIGFVSKVNRSERDMFSIMDQTGKAIEPTECDILREGTSIEIIPPSGSEIYGIVLYSNEIEHAMVIDNVTDFADTIHDPVINQKQSRIKLKTTRTKNWTGKLSTEGFIVNNDELIPNLDNLAQTMGRQTELGFIPVERDVYEASRRLYGYQERNYLTELDITDDQQFDFYKGMIQSKGTGTSLSRIGRSNKIIQGEMNVYDEWCLKVGDFGDVANDQSIELKITKANVVQDPQLISLAFPQDTTGTVSSVNVVNAKHRYFDLPTITINNPTIGSNVATVTPTLNSNGEISSITINNPGSGYTANTGLNIETANISTNNTDVRFFKVDAVSNSYVTVKQYNNANANLLVSSNVANITGLGNLTVTNASGSSNVSSTYNLGSITDVANIATFINEDATINSSITASVITVSGVSNVSSNSANVGYFTYLKISGNDFVLSDDDSNVTLGKLQLGDSSNRYQPRQRYKLATANNTQKANIVVSVDNNVVANSNYSFELGGRWQVSPLATFNTGSVTFGLTTTSTGVTTNILPDVGNAKTSFDLASYSTIDNNDFAFVDLFIDGNYIENEGDITYYTLTNNSITFPDVTLLPNKKITPQSNVYIIEHSTIEFNDGFKGDVPGSTLNIKATTNDDITAIVTAVRNFEITPDATDDEVILIDIDDTNRFLKKPGGLRSDELWKTTSNVSATGITDSKFKPLPNAGYVNPSNVTFSAFDVVSIGSLFDPQVVYKPVANDLIHVAKAENSDWNVYKLTDANSTLSFVEQDVTTETAYLYMNDVDLFSYVDNNAIGGTDNNRYLDYHLVIKDTNLTDQFVVWTNQEIVNKKGVKIKDFAGANMITANITSIGPSNVISINNITSAPTDTVVGIANVETVVSATTTQTVNNLQTFTVNSTSGIADGMYLSLSTGGMVGSPAKVTTVHDSTTISVSENVTLANGTALKFMTGNVNITTAVYNLENGDSVALEQYQPTQFTFNTTAVQQVAVVESANVSTSANVAGFTANARLTLANVKFNANSTIIDIAQIEANQYANVNASGMTTSTEYIIIDVGTSDFTSAGATENSNGTIFTATTNSIAGTGKVAPTQGVSYINESNITFPNSELSSSTTLVDMTFVDNNRLKLSVADINQSGLNIVRAGSTVDIISTNANFNDRNYVIEEVGQHYITILGNDDFPLKVSGFDEVVDLSNIAITGFKYNNHSNIHARDYTVSNVSATGFTIHDGNVTANIDQDNLSVTYFGRTEIHADTIDHNLTYGDIVKLEANSYSGFYFVEAATENTFTIDAPYNASVPASGKIIKSGIEVTTDANHGIDSAYAGKRIAIHMAEPNYYNRVYTVSDVPSNTSIKIADAYSFGSTANSQITTWSANMAITEGQRIKNGDIVYKANTSFTAGSEFSTTNLRLGKPAILTTIDHNRIRLNNTDIVLNDIKSEQDVVDSINTSMTLKRGAIDNDNFGISFPMISGKNEKKLLPILGDYRQIAGYSPYVNADNVDDTRLTDNMSRAGTLSYEVNKKGFVNDPTNPLQALAGVTPGSTLNVGPSDPAYLGDNNNYASRRNPGRIPLFNVPDENGTPIPQAGTTTGAKPIIDPRKAMANISKKPCVDMCSPIITPPTPITTPVPSQPQVQTICYGGTLLNPNTNSPGIQIISANSKGKRKFGSDYSGTYFKNGPNAGNNSQTGGVRGGLSPRALAGILIWSDNGSTNTFNISIKFSKAGTFHCHLFRAGRSGYEDRNYVNFSTASDGSIRHNAKFTGKSSFFGQNGRQFTVSKDEVVTFRGTARGGSNHWNGLCMHISASATGLDTCTKSYNTNVSAGTGFANQPSANYGNATISFHKEHNRQSNQTDTNFYTLQSSGTVKILLDMYSGADGLEVFQGASKGGENLRLASTGDQTLRRLTDAEKQEIISRAGNTGFGSNANQIKDFQYSGQNVRFGGALEFNVDINKGQFLKVVIKKPSIVYRYVMMMPNEPPVKKPKNPKQPVCGTPKGNVSTPIYSPGGQPTTVKKKKPVVSTPGTGGIGQGVGGGGNSGYGSGGVYNNYGNNYYMYHSTLKQGGGASRNNGAQAYHIMHNYGGYGLAPMAGFSMIPNIFKKTVKTTASNFYGKYQPLTDTQFVNNTVQRVTGGQVIPLAQPLRNVAPTRPGKLRALDINNYPFWDELTFTGDNFYIKGNNFFVYNPAKIGTDIRLEDGTLINNILDSFNVSDTISTGADITLTYPAQLPNVLPNPGNRPMEMEPSFELPKEDSPYDDEVDYNEVPVVGITPKIKDENGNYIPAGPTVYCDLARPTPGVNITLDDMVGIKPGDELIINSTKIKFPGSEPKTIENALRCTQGSGYMVHDTFKDGKPALRISSCSNAPLTIRDGCAGGVYREVLDFHVVRGFDQHETSNTAVLPSTTGHGGYAGQTSATGYTNVSPVTPTADYTLYNAEGDATGIFNGSGGKPNNTTGAVLSSKSKSTGGSGYSVGDRLRLVGGLPIESPYGGITEFCIDMPGMNYTSAANVKVYIGDGTTPGSGALAGQVVLNQTNGIESIQLISGGEGYDFNRPPKVRIIDLGTGNFNLIDAEVTAKIGSGKGLPPRVAKFKVASVDAIGTITSLQIIDRGIYKQFPADLTQGIPLEYDTINFGDETGVDSAGQYYQGTGLGQFDPLNEHERLDSPGGYDPINGLVGGGSGARVFLTAREIPDCSERGNARSTMGLPDRVTDINIPEDIAACINNALVDGGYDPSKIHFDTEPINDLLDLLKIRTPGYDGVGIDELSPGFLEKIGIPAGDYNIDSLCIDAVLDTSEPVVPRPKNRPEVGTNLLNDDGFKVSDLEGTPTITINCIDTIGYGPDTDGSGNSGIGSNGQDPNSILGDANVLFSTDMFQYELRSLTGAPVNMPSVQQECSVLYLESARYSKNNGNVVVRNGVNVALDTLSNVWIDDYNNSGWAYLEGNNAIATQSNLVDTNFVKNAILYDQDTGEKEVDLHFYDPFKGVLPGLIEKEIHFTGNNDPVVYNSARSGFGRKDIGKVWWNTSTIAYNWYEQGTNRERWLNWGSTFPGSGVTLYEWVEDTVPPVNYTGTGTPKNNQEFVVERRMHPTSNKFRNYYYFWVQNKTELENIAIDELGRQYDTLTLAKYIADPIGSGLPLISFVSNKAIVLSNIAPLLREDEQNLQINFSRNLNPVGQKHTAWKLARENDNNSIIPDDLANKLIDSLAGTDALGQSVPDPLLSEVEAYGVQFRPRQSMFKDVKGARQVLHYTLNEILADLQLNTNYPNWDSTLPANRTYLETVNWFGVQFVDASNNKKVRYDNTFKPIYKVNSVQELDTLQSIPDNTIVQVKSPNSTVFSLHKYIASTKTFELITIQNDNVKLKETIFTDDTNSTLSNEIRLLLHALKDNVFEGTNLWNKLFFALLKYAITEQKQLDWAFKTSYVFIEKEEEDLIEINGFKVDNFDKVLQYLDEVKPYSAKIREYKDGKSPIKEVIGVNAVSDFDKPPYADPDTGTVRVLDDFLQADSNIIQTNDAYTKYFSISNKSLDPIRHSNTTIKFDRVDYSLLPHDYEPAVNVATWTANATYPRNSYVVNNGTYYKANVDIASTSTFSSANWTALGSNVSVIPVADTSNGAIARNIVTLTAQTNAQVQSNTIIGASERAFKFNPTIQAQFTAELNDYYSITDSSSNANVINSSDLPSSIANITTVVNSGGLDKTLALVKTATGGDFQGEIIDGNLFNRAYGVDTNTYQSTIGFNRTGWDSDNFDVSIDVENYEGVFNTAISGNEVSFERDGTLYEGFDGVTFKRVLYGEERPQELALVEPLETIIFRVTSHKHLQGNTSLTAASSNASTVKYQIVNNIYGENEFIRVKQDGTTTTTVTANLYTYSDTITVANASVLEKPKARLPGIIWVGTERIEYTSRNVNTNTLSGLTRGTNGTSKQDWDIGTEVWNANSTEQFDSYPTTSNIWLDNGAVSLADLGNANVSSSTSIMRFLHGRE